jgi:hypothetical protein
VFVSADTGLDKLPANQPVYARGAINWAKLFASVDDLAKQRNAKAGVSSPQPDPVQQARDFFKKVDIDLDTELLGNLQPGFALSVGIAPTASLSTALNFNPARVDPFENYTLAVIAHVKDAAKAKGTLEKLAKLGTNIGATITTKDVAGGLVYVVTYKRGEDVHEGMSWTLRGNEVILSGGYGEKLPELIKLVTGSGASLKKDQFPARTREILFADQGLAFALDMKKVDEAVRGLQSDSGPGAEMMRSAFTTILSQVSAIRPAVGIAPTQGGLLVDAAISLQ